jgi:hypothetical protein
VVCGTALPADTQPLALSLQLTCIVTWHELVQIVLGWLAAVVLLLWKIWTMNHDS